ncbi:MAG: ADP-forming succinate--CoA ligase subunit beta [Myxococcota bacterium]
MNVHEYQAKSLFRQFGVAVPDGELATTPGEAEAAAKRLDAAVVVVKAQVHAGGRGKGGGIQLAKSPAEAKQRASEILGMTLVTHQTGPEGKLVRKVYVEVGSEIARELYLALTLDRASESFAVIASTEGGMDIEQVAAKTPERIHTEFVDPVVGLQGYQIRKLARALRLDAEQSHRLDAFLRGLYRLFVEKDASLVEINPLVVTQQGELFALDGKLNFDDNALYRHPDIAALRDPEEEDPRERAAKEIDLAYVGLDGDVGCMVNGAGLAMATLDMITVCGGRPANFLDAGGGADKEKVKEAFKLILRDDKVRAILVNIFGGIVRCDLIAEGVVAAAGELGVTVPLVVRLQGTNAEQGRKLLADSGLGITPADTLREAAEKAVAAARGK